MKKKYYFAIVLFQLFIFVSYAFSQGREPQPVEFRKISDRLYEIIGGQGANGGAYIGDNEVLLIDSKMDEKSVNQVITGIKKLTDKQIKYLVNTHSDGDHIAGNQFFPETVTFISHENCRKELFHPGRDGTASEWNSSELAAFIPSLTFREKMDMYLGSKKVELWYFGVGHTTGDIVVYFPGEKTAFIGDQAFLTRPQLIHSYKGGNSFEHVKTLTKMLDTLDAENFCSGHSEMTDRNVIRNHIDSMKKRQEKVAALIKKKKSLEEVMGEFDKSESRLIESIFNELKSSGR